MNLAAKVQGSSEPELRARFGTEEQCLAVLFESAGGTASSASTVVLERIRG